MNEYFRPCIAISGLKIDRWEQTVLKDLKSTGFIIIEAEEVNDKEGAVLLTLGPSLVSKLVVSNGICTFQDDFLKYTYEEKVAIVRFSLDFLLMDSKYSETDIFIIHDEEEKNKIAKSDKGTLFLQDSVLKAINTYYGASVALYFSWASYYNLNLLFPAIFGIVAFTSHDASISSFVPSVLLSYVEPLFCIIICLWSTILTEFWKGRNASLSYLWSLGEVGELTQAKNLIKDTLSLRGNKEINRLFRFLVTVPIMIFSLLIPVRIMLFYLYLQESTQILFGEKNYLQYILVILYCCIINLSYTVFIDFIATRLNKYEAHSSQENADYFLVVKQFLFEFVNRFSLLFYTAIYLQDMKQLRYQILYIFISGFVFSISGEIFYLVFRKSAISCGPNVLKNSPILKADMIMAKFRVDRVMLDQIMQYGLIVMFSIGLPILPVLALIGNMIKSHIDLVTIGSYRRPLIDVRSSLGPWLFCLELTSFCGVATTCFLICEVSDYVTDISTDAYDGYFASETGRFVTMVVLEHVFIGLKIALMCLIEDVPRWVQVLKFTYLYHFVNTSLTQSAHSCT